ncbi:IS110 family transposase [Legionella pneumophila]|uniref:Transposase, IS116/IS110/IS902 n=1 Tax=Legionella pneumophila subsp. pneumophila TaxID=91891 RepID=A0AAV2UVQ3_LEGPN|nr:IS110 family transposase [Legionella pneumophila]CCD05188.1 Transposase, IS116/IS110/IS902 [Legionella pneumophila subsp. pneumophila]
MITYTSFIGIDIGKYSFVVALHGNKKVDEYENTPSGIEEFIQSYKKDLIKGLCILETTGGYEMGVLLTLCSQGFAVHRANTRKVKHFIKSYGNAAKTDKLDAKNLGLYGFERGKALELFTPQSKQSGELYEMIQRRTDLKQMLVAEKNRLKAPRAACVKESIQSLIEILKVKLEAITEEINSLIAQDPVLSEKKKILKTIPGIGDIIANELLILLPELGQLSRREIASLVGVAPRCNDSGTLQGYRRTTHGRAGVKPLLFLAAMAARNSNSILKTFYEGLLARGKIKMVALVALMRKIIVIANARLKIVQPITF